MIRPRTRSVMFHSASPGQTRCGRVFRPLAVSIQVPCRRFRQRRVCAGRGHVSAAVAGFTRRRVLPAGTMAAVTGTAPDGDLAVVAELQGMLIEILEARNAELTAQVADPSERLA